LQGQKIASMTKEEALQIAKKFLKENNWHYKKISLSEETDEGIVFDLHIPQIFDGDFGGPFSVLVQSSKECKIIE